MITTSRLQTLLNQQGNETPVHAIVRALSSDGSLSMAELQGATSLAKSTVSTALSELRRSGIVVAAEQREKESGVPGRRPTAFTLNPEAGTCVGVHLELDGVRICIADAAHTIIDEQFIALGLDYAPEHAIQSTLTGAAALYRNNGLTLERLLGVGVSVSGPVTPQGFVHKSSILPAWSGTNVRELFANAFRKPVFADNESNCAATAELMWGAAKDHKDFLLFKIDLGVGGAVVIDGKVIVGAAGGAGEIGHMSIERNGRLCRCGNRGCLEIEASLLEPTRQLSEVHGRPLVIEDVLLLAEQGDSGANRMIEDCAEAAGRGLAAMAAMINPPLVILSGKAALAGERFLRPFQQAFERNALVRSRDVPTENATIIRIGDFTLNDSLLGAVGLVLRSIGSMKTQHMHAL
jgi:predicted NBD/HSP70 family sugar kinase